MAETNFTLEECGAGVRLGMPAISIPDDFQLIGNELSFEIETADGQVAIRGDYLGFICEGYIKALEAAGLLQGDWVPQKDHRQQIVVFEETGPRLYPRRTTAILESQHIIIYRRSRGRGVVQIASQEQRTLIRKAIEARTGGYEFREHGDLLNQVSEYSGGSPKRLAPVLRLVPKTSQRNEDLEEMRKYVCGLLGAISKGEVAGLSFVYETYDGKLCATHAGWYRRDKAHCAGILHAALTRVTDQLGE